jgi:hypothetical protein
MLPKIKAGLLISCVNLVAAASAHAQIAPGDKIVRLPAAPAPLLAAADQQVRTIWPLIRFDLPTNALAIRVSRLTAGSATPVLLTPTDIPVTSIMKVTMIDHTYFAWPDNSLTALGSYSYSISAVLDDGRVGTSSWLAYSPQVYEPQSVAAQKLSPYSVAVGLSNSVFPAKTYRLYGTGIAPFGMELTTTDKARRYWTIQLSNLAAGTYNFIVRSEFDPGIRSNGVPVSITLP